MPLVLLLLVAPARADLITSLVPVANGPGTATYDLVVTVKFDVWTSTQMKASLSGAKFFQHPAGSNTQPDPALFAAFPTLQWDTFATCPDGWPNTATQGVVPAFAFPPVFGETVVDALWFDVPPNSGDGTWTLARLTVQDIAGEWTLQLSGAHSHLYGSLLIPFQFTVPEPQAALLLLVLTIATAHAGRRP